MHDLPILAGPLSGLRQSEHPNVISTYDLLFRAGLDPEVDFCNRVGKPVLSKKLNQWLKASNAYQILVQNSALPDAFRFLQTLLSRCLQMTFRSLGEVPVIYRRAWLTKWQKMNYQAVAEVESYVNHATDEAANVGVLLDKLTEEDTFICQQQYADSRY